MAHNAANGYRVGHLQEAVSKSEVLPPDSNMTDKWISHFNDELSILRVINIPQRGIGESTIDKIKQYAKVNHMEFIDALKLTKAINPNIT